MMAPLVKEGNIMKNHSMFANLKPVRRIIFPDWRGAAAAALPVLFPHWGVYAAVLILVLRSNYPTFRSPVCPA